MALVNEPKVLFLDEPTVGADVRTRNQILQVVRQKAEAGCAIVYTSHYLTEIEDLGATVAVLEEGRIIARGSLAGLVAQARQSGFAADLRGPGSGTGRLRDRRFGRDAANARTRLTPPPRS
jgi:ABC-type multidrug transport system ATPase subunit